MSAPDPSVIRRAAAEFPTKQPVRFEILQPWKDVIEELRSKRASCYTIAEFLSGYGIQTSKSTIANFCKEVLNEPGKRKPTRRRRKLEPSPSTHAVTPLHANGSAEGPPPKGKHLVLANGVEPVADTRRKRGPRIANIELIED